MPAASLAGRLGVLALVHVAAVACARVPDMTAVPLAGGCQSAIFTGASAAPLTTVSWITPEDESERATLAQWCETVGPALVAPSPAQFTEDRVTSFAVVSWNQHVGGGALRRLVSDLRAGILTNGVPVDQYILLLQETYRTGSAVPAIPPASAPIPPRIANAPGPGQDREDIRTVATALGLAFFYAPSMRNGREVDGEPPEDRGNAILATMPLEGFRVVTLPFERQRRASISAMVRVPDGQGRESRIELSSLHLDVWPATVPSLLDGSRRLRQSSAFLSLLPERGSPVLIGADLNAISSGDSHVELYRARWPDWEVPDECQTRWMFCSDYLFAGDLPDWVLTPAAVVPDAYGSDHRPVVSLATRADQAVAER